MTLTAVKSTGGDFIDISIGENKIASVKRDGTLSIQKEIDLTPEDVKRISHIQADFEFTFQNTVRG